MCEVLSEIISVIYGCGCGVGDASPGGWPLRLAATVGDAVDAFAAALDSFNVNVMGAKPTKQNFDLFALSLQAALDSANDASIQQKAADVEMRIDLNDDSKPF